MSLEQIRKPEHDPLALARPELRPGTRIERAPCRCDGRVDVGRIALRNARDLLATRGIEYRKRAPAQRLDERAADEHARVRRQVLPARDAQRRKIIGERAHVLPTSRSSYHLYPTVTPYQRGGPYISCVKPRLASGTACMRDW